MKKNSKNNSQQVTKNSQNNQNNKGRWTIGKVAKKTSQIILGIGVGTLAIEGTAVAATGTIMDAKAGMKFVDYKKHPEKYTHIVKTGLFKKETVLVNPVTGAVTKVDKKISKK